MITDRELDRQLAGAAGVHDAALPPLPEDFLDVLIADAHEPASVIAARQLVADAHDARTVLRPRRSPRRKAIVRAGLAVLAVAAAWTTAVLVTPSDRLGTPADPTSTEAGPSGSPTGAPAPNGIALVSAEQITFPLSLDPVPTGLTPLFSRRGGVAFYGDQPLVFSADYGSPDGNRVLVTLFPEDPRGLGDYGFGVEGGPSATVPVGGREAEVWLGESSVSLLWERPDGRWVLVMGEGSYADIAAVVPVAESIVDRPQPLGLQFGLAPAGWSVTGYEESRSIDLTSDVDPQQLIRLSVYQPGPGTTIDTLFGGITVATPVQTVTIQGQPARMAVQAGDADHPDVWTVVGQLPGGQIFLLLAPESLTQDQVLQIAEQITYSG